MNDLATRIREALDRDAERAPEPPATWTGPVLATSPTNTTRRSRTLVGSVAAGSLVVAGLAATAWWPPSDTSPTIEPAATPDPPATTISAAEEEARREEAIREAEQRRAEAEQRGPEVTTGSDDLPEPPPETATPRLDPVVVVDGDTATNMLPPIPLPAQLDGPAVQIANGDVWRTTVQGDQLCVSRTDPGGGGASACGNPSETGGLLSFMTATDDPVTTFILTSANTELSFVPQDCATTWTSSTADLVLHACQAASDVVGVTFKVADDPTNYRFAIDVAFGDRPYRVPPQPPAER